MKKQKWVFSEIGLAIALTTILVSVIQLFLRMVILRLLPSVASSGWLSYILLIVLYVVGLPFFFLLVKHVPNSIKSEKKKLSVKEILILFFITYAAMIITNIFTLILMRLVAVVKGTPVVNPLNTMVGSSSIIGTFIFAGVLSPIVEETIFRGIMLNKLKCFGDKTAILTTALLFGLFHANFSQFFYATAIGIVLAYVAIKTGTIKYTIMLHIMINMMGSVIAVLASKNIVAQGIFGLCVITFTIAGIVLLIVKRKKISLSPAEEPIAEGHVFKTICVNFGMIFNFVVNMFSMILMLFV